MTATCWVRRAPGAMTAAVLAWGLAAGCGGTEPPVRADLASARPPAPAPKPAVERPEGPLPALLVSHSWFEKVGGELVPQPAKLSIWRTDGATWWEEVLEDEGSNVFHKAIPWEGGILTIAAGQLGQEPPRPAQLRHWVKRDGAWVPTTLWERVWEGRIQRLRDFELGDLDGDGDDDIVIATHDMGVVAVGTRGADGAWTFEELDPKPDTFVHEIELGDLDGDGRKEIYATPSDRNKSTGESQPGAVVRYDLSQGRWERSTVFAWQETHAKEITVADVDGDGVDELYVVREAQVVKDGERTRVEAPVRILRAVREGAAWKEELVAEIDDRQLRFLVPGDVDHDGRTELVAAGYKSGLWLLEPRPDGTFDASLIDRMSSGYEHATHVADLDGDGKLEIYVAADDQRQIRRYVWDGTTFARERIADIPDLHITWSLQDAKL